MKKILYFASAVLALVAVSCNKYEVTDAGHTPGEPDAEGCYNVYFPTQEASGSHSFDPTMDPVVEFTVVRENAKGKINVPFVAQESDTCIFEYGKIEFENGQDTTKLVVRFDKAEMGKKYSLSLSIVDPQYASKYTENARNLDFSAMRVEWKYVENPKTKEPAKVTFNQTWWGDIATGKIKYYEVGDIRYCQTETDPTHIGSEGPYEGYGFLGTAEKPEDAVEWEFKWYFKSKNANDLNYLEIGQDGTQVTGWNHKTIGPVTTCDYYGWWTKLNPQAALAGVDFLTFAQKNEANYPIGYYDGNGGFVLRTAYYVSADLRGWSNGGADDIIAIVEGYVRTDFEIKEVSTTYAVNGVQPIEVETGRDVTSLRYACVTGELSATAAGKVAEAIQKGEQPDVKTTTDYVYDPDEDKNYYNYGVSFAKTDIYTCVIVANSSDTTYSYKSVVLDYVSAADADSLSARITVAAEDVPERYGFTKNEAFAFYLAGKELTEVNFTVVPTAFYTKNQEMIEAFLKYPAKYADEIEEADLDIIVAAGDTLAAINALGGWYRVISGCSPLTDYTVAVWATNGKQDTYKVASYTTDGLPLVPFATGDYTYNGYFKGVDHNLTMYADPNYENTYVIKPWAAETEFIFTWDGTSKVNVSSPNPLGVTYGSYGPLYAVDAILIPTIAAEMGPSFYAADSTTFTFSLAFIVAAGRLTKGHETFKITSFAPTTKSTVSAYYEKKVASVEYKSLSREYPVKVLPKIRKAHFDKMVVERENKSVCFESVNLQYTKKASEAKERKLFSAPQSFK